MSNKKNPHWDDFNHFRLKTLELGGGFNIKFKKLVAKTNEENCDRAKAIEMWWLYHDAFLEKYGTYVVRGK